MWYQSDLWGEEGDWRVSHVGDDLVHNDYVTPKPG